MNGGENVSNAIECCAKCGSTFLGKYPKMTICTDCAEDTNMRNRVTLLYRSKHPKVYYEELSKKKYGTAERWKEIFVDIELSKEPTFSPDKYQISIVKQNARIERANHKAVTVNLPNIPEDKINIPKCPTCQSTNIKKISALKRETHVLLFGIFSKTATSQFECDNCGYKW